MYGDITKTSDLDNLTVFHKSISNVCTCSTHISVYFFMHFFPLPKTKTKAQKKFHLSDYS